MKPAHLREVAAAISSLGFCDPVLIDERNAVLDGVVRVEAA
jgi:ParB-like chromosome segregation protein Spo0J